MSVLGDTFTLFAKRLKPDYVWQMDATLTGTKLSSLSAFVAIAGAVAVAYDPGLTPLHYHLPQRSSSKRRFSSNLILERTKG